jgi:hypothetical protein
VIIRAATRERLERHLDDLTATGHFHPRERARLGADQATEHLSRLLRTVEHTGHDPRTILAAAVTAGPLDDADSIAQVLSHRIRTTGPAANTLTDLAAGAAAGAAASVTADAVADENVPADISAEAAARLADLTDRYRARRHQLGADLANRPPPWALDTLGPVPTAGDGRDEWDRKARVVAAYREAVGWDDPHRPLGPMPGLATTERRAAYATAWHALDRPETGLDEAALPDGRLRVRVRAAQAELAWAPPHVDDALRHAETAVESARHAAASARVAAEDAARAGDSDAAARLLTEADSRDADSALRSAAVQRLTFAAEARARWAAATLATRQIGERAHRELTARGLAPGNEPDVATAGEWLAADRAARQTDDAHRPITDRDLIDRPRHAFGDDISDTVIRTLTDDSEDAGVPRTTANQLPHRKVDTYTSRTRDEQGPGHVADDRSGDANQDYLAEPAGSTAAQDRVTRALPREPTDDQLQLAVAAATVAFHRGNQHDSDHAMDAHEPEHSSWLQHATTDGVNAAERRPVTRDHVADRTPRQLDGSNAADYVDDVDEVNGS